MLLDIAPREAGVGLHISALASNHATAYAYDHLITFEICHPQLLVLPENTGFTLDRLGVVGGVVCGQDEGQRRSSEEKHYC